MKKEREYFKNKTSGRITMSKTKEDTGSAGPELRGAQRDYINGGRGRACAEFMSNMKKVRASEAGVGVRMALPSLTSLVFQFWKTFTWDCFSHIKVY